MTAIPNGQLGFPTQQTKSESPDCSTIVTMPLNSIQRDSSSSDDYSDESSSDHSQRSSPRQGENFGAIHPQSRNRSLTDRLAKVTSSSTQVPTGAKEVDDLLSKEMYNLTFADRTAISEEIHGVRCLAPEETQDLIHQSLLKLQEQLDLMPFKPSYDKAQEFAQDPAFSNTSYVNTVDFRLKFLRCELFHAAKAAIRLVKYLDLMLELYGLFALQRKIKLTDFSKHEMQILRAGYFQMFPFRDRSGRRVMSIVGNMGAQYDPFVRVRKLAMYSLYIFVLCDACSMPNTFSL